MPLKKRPHGARKTAWQAKVHAILFLKQTYTFLPTERLGHAGQWLNTVLPTPQPPNLLTEAIN